MQQGAHSLDLVTPSPERNACQCAVASIANVKERIRRLIREIRFE
jgi:hypothetical protein